ncbi:hypothetical protein IPA_02130 [Ignicoccus pacificus DSM 13166]|uniref:Uncharacterized protein n=1 Tax=Ignicoccus pacificus DSM 13166 TaxID=940294 RepID=A0A977KAM9_9CREN|nr:hypothetical protein IPA_02130 [Ignicoccus pacificus DSM 13166]
MVFGSKGSLSYSEARDAIAKWLLLGNVEPCRAPPIFVYSEPGFSINHLIADAFKTAMSTVKGTYEEKVPEDLKAFVTALERIDNLGILHTLTKYDDVKVLFNTKEKGEGLVIYTVTPEYLKKEGLDGIVEALSRADFAVLHVYNALDGIDEEVKRMYEAMVQGLWSKLNKPIIFSQQLVPGVSKRALSLGFGTGGIAIMKVELPNVEEWASWVSRTFKVKADRDVIEFVKVISPETLPLPFAELLREINERAYGVGDPFSGKELFVVEREGIRIEATPVLGSPMESLPSPDGWTKVALLPWNYHKLARELAIAVLGSTKLVDGLELYKRKAKMAPKIIKDLEDSVSSGRSEGAIEDLVQLINDLEEHGGDEVASAILIRALASLYKYAEKFESWETCDEECRALKIMCELHSRLKEIQAPLLRKIVEEINILVVELTGAEAGKACAKLKLLI